MGNVVVIEDNDLLSVPLKASLAPQAGATRFKRLRRRVVLFGVLVLLAFAGASAYDIWNSYRIRGSPPIARSPT